MCDQQLCGSWVPRAAVAPRVSNLLKRIFPCPSASFLLRMFFNRVPRVDVLVARFSRANLGLSFFM
jgi:hypothetical protein